MLEHKMRMKVFNFLLQTAACLFLRTLFMKQKDFYPLSNVSETVI